MLCMAILADTLNNSVRGAADRHLMYICMHIVTALSICP